MAEGKDRYKQLNFGQHGNYTKEELFDDSLRNQAIAYEVELGVLQAGCTLLDVDLIHDAMGANVTLGLGYKFVDPAWGAAAPLAIRAQTAAAAAVNTSFNLAVPLVLEHDAILTLTVAGAQVANDGVKNVRVRPGYRFTDV